MSSVSRFVPFICIYTMHPMRTKLVLYIKLFDSSSLCKFLDSDCMRTRLRKFGMCMLNSKPHLQMMRGQGYKPRPTFCAAERDNNEGVVR